MSTSTPAQSGALAPGAKPVRIQVSSDLHMECDRNYNISMNRPKGVEYLILAGDTGSVGRQKHQALLRQWLIEQCKQYVKVIYIVGNNDCKGTTLEQGHDVLRQWEKQPEFKGRLVFLEKGRYDLNEYGHDVSILGCTLWTELDVDENGEVVVGNWLDYEITDNSAAQHHKRYLDSYKWLVDEVANVQKEKGEEQRIVVVTHHAPCVRGAMAPGDNHHRQGKYVNDLLGNVEIDGLWESGKNYWVLDTPTFLLTRRWIRSMCIQTREVVRPRNMQRIERDRWEEMLVIIGREKVVLRCR